MLLLFASRRPGGPDASDELRATNDRHQRAVPPSQIRSSTRCIKRIRTSADTASGGFEPLLGCSSSGPNSPCWGAAPTP